MVKTGFGGAIHGFNKPNGSQSEDAWLYDDSPSLTRQEFAAECDINTIMAQYEKTGALPVNGRDPNSGAYIDFTDLPGDLAGTLELLGDATNAFMQLPATVRREFDNDPVKFVDFAADPANLPQMRDWGLAEPLPPPPPPKEALEPKASPEPPKAS